MSITCEASPARPIPVPRPNSAVTIGSPAATSDPNVISNTTIAASRPMTVAVPIDGFWVCSTASPPSATAT